MSTIFALFIIVFGFYVAFSKKDLGPVTYRGDVRAKKPKHEICGRIVHDNSNQNGDCYPGESDVELYSYGYDEQLLNIKYQLEELEELIFDTSLDEDDFYDQWDDYSFKYMDLDEMINCVVKFRNRVRIIKKALRRNDDYELYADEIEDIESELKDMLLS